MLHSCSISENFQTGTAKLKFISNNLNFVNNDSSQKDASKGIYLFEAFNNISMITLNYVSFKVHHVVSTEN